MSSETKDTQSKNTAEGNVPISSAPGFVPPHVDQAGFNNPDMVKHRQYPRDNQYHNHGHGNNQHHQSRRQYGGQGGYAAGEKDHGSNTYNQRSNKSKGHERHNTYNRPNGYYPMKAYGVGPSGMNEQPMFMRPPHTKPTMVNTPSVPVNLTDANGNVIDMATYVKQRHQQTGTEAQTAPAVPAKFDDAKDAKQPEASPAAVSVAPEVPVAKTAPPASAAKPSDSNVQIVINSAVSETPEFVKPKPSNNDTADKFREMIAARKKAKELELKKAEEEAMQKTKAEEEAKAKAEAEAEAKAKAEEEAKVKAEQLAKEQAKSVSTPETSSADKQADSAASAPKPGVYRPKILRELDAKRQKEQSVQPSTEPNTALESKFAPTPETQAPPSTTPAPVAPSVPALETKPVASELSKITESAGADETEADSEAASALADQKFYDLVEKARRLTPAELTTFSYPSNSVPNTAANSDAQTHRYTIDFLRQFGFKVPRVNRIYILKTMDVDINTATNWSVGSARGMSNRNNSRNGGGMGQFSNRMSGRGNSTRSRQSSKRKNGRRDQDDNPLAHLPLEDLPPLKTAENAWKPNFKLKLEAAKAAAGVANGEPVPPVAVDVPEKMSPEEIKKKTNSLLNKMTLENLQRISDKLYDLIMISEGEDDAATMKQVITLAFNKAIDEPNYTKVYVEFFLYLHKTKPLPDTIVDNSDPNKPRTGMVVLRHVLLHLCQQALQNGSYLSDDQPTPDDLSDEYYEFMAKKRRALGAIKFVGELYKAGLIRINAIAQSFYTLAESKPTEDIVESCTQLLRSVAWCMVQRKEDDILFPLMKRIADWRSSPGFPSRLKFMLIDIEQLSKNKWVDPKGDNGPKTIAEVHMDAKAKEEAELKQKHNMQMRSKSGRGRVDGRTKRK